MEEKMAADALATVLSTYTSLQATASTVLQTCWQSKATRMLRPAWSARCMPLTRARCSHRAKRW